MRNSNPLSEKWNVTTFCSGRRFFDVFSLSWNFYKEKFVRYTYIRYLLVKTNLLNYNTWYFWPCGRFRSSRRDATATRMTKYWNTLNRRKRSFIPPLIIPETYRKFQDIASREVPQCLQTLCLKVPRAGHFDPLFSHRNLKEHGRYSGERHFFVTGNHFVVRYGSSKL